MSSSDAATSDTPDASPGTSHGVGVQERRDGVGPVAWLLAQLVRLYQLTGPFRQPRCRFHPSCSTYAFQAITTHGAVKGGWLATRRLLRCHPWNPGGVDHVPPRSSR